MGIRWGVVLAFSSVCLGLACGDAKPGDNGDGDALSASQGDGNDVDDVDGWAPPCEASNHSQVLLDDVDALDFAVAGDQIVFADWSLGPRYLFDHMNTGGIRSVNIDGTGPRVLFTAPEEHEVFHAFVEGADVYFPMTQPVEDQVRDRATYLWRMPLTGGEPTLFSKPEGSYDKFAEIFASDADSLYLESSEQVVRVSKKDGTAVVIADIGLDIVDQSQLFEGKVWFTTFQGDGLVRSVPADASGPADQVFGQDTCGLRSLSVTPAGVFCGLSKYGADGKLVWFDGELEDYTPGGVSTPVGNKVVLYGGERMDELDVYSYEQRTLVCDATSAVDIHVREDAVYWLEHLDSDAKHRLFRAPR
jgi:hypothetical protein